MMTKTATFLILLLALHGHAPARADTVRDFVRTACVPEAGLLDVEYRGLHDSVAVDRGGKEQRNSALAQAGFHPPRGLKLSCRLGDVSYAIATDQGPTSERRCGGSPEVYLSITRNGEKILSDVVLGESCQGLPSVTRITIGDGPQSWRGRETQLCYSKEGDSGKPQCEWIFGDQKRLQQILGRD